MAAAGGGGGGSGVAGAAKRRRQDAIAKAAAANRERGLQQALRAEGFAPEMAPLLNVATSFGLQYLGFLAQRFDT